MDRKAICITIGQNIRNQREQDEISETALAFYLGIPLEQLQKYETGDDSPTCDELIQIARLFGCSVDALCS